MATYTKELSRRTTISEDDERDTVMLVQKNDPKLRDEDDIVVLNSHEAERVYAFLHRKFGGQ